MRRAEPFGSSAIPLVRMPFAAESTLPLVQAARQHDTHAWNRLLKQHERALFVYIADIIGNETAALDLIQEPLANAVRYIGGLKDDAKFTPWLFGIAHQKCVQYWRSQRRDETVFAKTEEELGPEAEAVEGNNPFTLLVRHEQEATFLTCLDRLPESQRAVILLRLLEDFSLQEISDITGSPLGTVKSRLHHAIRALRASLTLNPS